jgi:hypothetical protein
MDKDGQDVKIIAKYLGEEKLPKFIQFNPISFLFIITPQPPV